MACSCSPPLLALLLQGTFCYTSRSLSGCMKTRHFEKAQDTLRCECCRSAPPVKHSSRTTARRVISHFAFDRGSTAIPCVRVVENRGGVCAHHRLSQHGQIQDKGKIFTGDGSVQDGEIARSCTWHSSTELQTIGCDIAMRAATAQAAKDSLIKTGELHSHLRLPLSGNLGLSGPRLLHSLEPISNVRKCRRSAAYSSCSDDRCRRRRSFLQFSRRMSRIIIRLAQPPSCRFPDDEKSFV